MYRQEDSYEVRYLASAVAERLRGRSASPSTEALASAIAERLRDQAGDQLPLHEETATESDEGEVSIERRENEESGKKK